MQRSDDQGAKESLLAEPENITEHTINNYIIYYSKHIWHMTNPIYLMPIQLNANMVKVNSTEHEFVNDKRCKI